MLDIERRAKLKKLRLKYINPVDIRAIDEIEKNLRINIVRAGFADHKISKLIIEQGQKEIDSITSLLAYDETLSTEQRLALFKERDVHEFYLSRFGVKANKGAIIAIDQEIETNLKD